MLEILYEDNDIIVVVKPPGMLSQGDPSGDADVYNQVKKHTEGQVGLVQRLDRPVGGVMVLTKSSEASAQMTAMVTERKIDKYYLALVNGKAKEKDHLEHWLMQVRGNRSVISGNKVRGSKKAVLSYERLGTFEDEHGEVSLLKVKLMTGRHHQIRAQLAHVKLPLVGDTKYNPAYQQLSGWHEIGLYAYELAFKHPVNGKELQFIHKPDFGPFSAVEKYL